MGRGEEDEVGWGGKDGVVDGRGVDWAWLWFKGRGDGGLRFICCRRFVVVFWNKLWGLFLAEHDT